MAAYVSAAFEKSFLPSSGRIRIVVRNLDQGDVPPSPSATYFPTQPAALRKFIVVDYISDTIGERWNRVATVADINTLTPRSLNVLEAASGNFIASGVLSGDIVEITLSEPAAWTSAEYPTTNPFQFTVVSVLSATQIQVSPDLPAFLTNMNWSIPARSINNTDGITRRAGSPPGPASFLDVRFNNYFTDVVTADNFVIATKADMDALAAASSATALTSENYTSVVP